MAPKKVPVEIATPHGTVAWKQITKDPPAQVAAIERELTAAELAGLNWDAKNAKKLVEKYVPRPERQDDLLLNLDLAFSAWLRSNRPRKEPATKVIRLLGAAYGSYCIARLGMRWAVIQDEHGTDIALVRENPTARAFPFSSIQYRVEDGKCDFIYAMYASLRHLFEDASK
jgi:hypothetical protein